jgi:beta-galactosidase/beta-glucuronidase
MSLLSTSSRIRDRRSLDGQWSFALDPHDTGEQATWSTADLSEIITVPGSWEEQGFGAPPTSH